MLSIALEIFQNEIDIRRRDISYLPFNFLRGQSSI